MERRAKPTCERPWTNTMNGTFNTDYLPNLPYGCYMFKAMRQRSIGAALEEILS